MSRCQELKEHKKVANHKTLSLYIYVIDILYVYYIYYIYVYI